MKTSFLRKTMIYLRWLWFRFIIHHN